MAVAALARLTALCALAASPRTPEADAPPRETPRLRVLILLSEAPAPEKLGASQRNACEAALGNALSTRGVRVLDASAVPPALRARLAGSEIPPDDAIAALEVLSDADVALVGSCPARDDGAPPDARQHTFVAELHLVALNLDSREVLRRMDVHARDPNAVAEAGLAIATRHLFERHASAIAGGLTAAWVRWLAGVRTLRVEVAAADADAAVTWLRGAALHRCRAARIVRLSHAEGAILRTPLADAEATRRCVVELGDAAYGRTVAVDLVAGTVALAVKAPQGADGGRSR